MVSKEANSRPQRHPPYKEMILMAVRALREETRTWRGASRGAIANHIAAAHSATLSTRHAALLSRNLAALASSGLLHRVGRHNYTLPRSSPHRLHPSASPVLLPGRGRRRGRGGLRGRAAMLVFPDNRLDESVSTKQAHQDYHQDYHLDGSPPA